MKSYCDDDVEKSRIVSEKIFDGGVGLDIFYHLRANQ